jgi:L-amino acid N-acyltransferase YncA
MIDMTSVSPFPDTLAPEQATTYATWFAALADPTRVRVLHTVATSPYGIMVGHLGELLGISQPTCSHHVRKLAEVGFVLLHKEGTATIVTINSACCVGIPNAADAVMGLLSQDSTATPEISPDVTIRPLSQDDWPDVRRIYSSGIAASDIPFETSVPSRTALDARWLADHRWIAAIGGEVVGWCACSPVSGKDFYAGVADTSMYATGPRAQEAGQALLHKQITEADSAGLWTLQAVLFPENKSSLALHRAAGYRVVGLRERIAKQGGVWRDTVLLERRSA